MAKTTARERRAEARGQRRAAAHDDSTVDEAVEAVESDPAEALRTAASAAIAAAAVGAARALAKRRHEEGPENEVADAEDVEDDVPAEEPEDDEPDDDEPEESAPRDSVSSSAARRIVEQARRQLSELHGADAESVSAVRRIADGWRIGLEVVEVHRIPESTDVLATYEVELDDNGDLITFERTTRYYRSEADRR